MTQIAEPPLFHPDDLPERPVVTASPMTMVQALNNHRIADGAEVARFLCELRGLIERPETPLLDL